MKITLFLLAFNAFNSFSQVIEKLEPDTIHTNPMFITAAFLEKFNSEESMNDCIKIWKQMRIENRDYTQTTKKEDETLAFCDEMRESPWEVIGGGCSWYCAGDVDSIYASSSLADQGIYSYKASNCHDLSYKTPWIEGADGDGIGESITYSFLATNPRITKIIITNGFVLSEDTWRENSRVKTLKLFLNDKEFALLHLKDITNDQVFKFDPIGNGEREDWDKLQALPNWTLRFEIVEVYKGTLYSDTAITEIFFDGIDHH